MWNVSVGWVSCMLSVAWWKSCVHYPDICLQSNALTAWCLFAVSPSQTNMLERKRQWMIECRFLTTGWKTLIVVNVIGGYHNSLSKNHHDFRFLTWEYHDIFFKYFVSTIHHWVSRSTTMVPPTILFVKLMVNCIFLYYNCLKLLLM